MENPAAVVNLIVDIGNTLTKTALFDAEGFETEAPVVEFSAGWVDESQRPSGALTLQHAPRGKIDRLLKKDHLEIQRSAFIPYRNKLNRMKEQ